MKVSVTYQDRTYGNATRSPASEIDISGYDNERLVMKIQFKEPQKGRSWDWLSAATVGGAELEIAIDDAKALANALLAYVSKFEEMGRTGTVSVRLRLLDGHPAEQNMEFQTREEFSEKIRQYLERKAE